MNIPVYNAEGKEVEQLQVADGVFGVDVKEHIVAEAMHAQRAAGRDAIAHAQERSEVRGGGRKPWRQKGTGRARAGSTRSPLWKGGGVTFGPRNTRNFSVKINRKVKKAALKMVLSDKVQSGQLVVVDQLPSDGKTKGMAALRKALPGGGRKALVALASKDDNVMRALSNVPKTSTIAAQNVNVLDLLNNQYLLTTKEGVKVMERVFA